MDNFKVTNCRLCLQTILDTNFEVIDDSTKEILNILLLKLKFNEGGVYVMCSVCSTKLKAAFEFKYMCLRTDDTVLSYIDCETALPLDIREIYMKENMDNQSISVSSDQKICRLCLQLVNDEPICVKEVVPDAIKEFIPEMKVNAVPDPVMCLSCFKSLLVHNNFLKECMEAERKIENIWDNQEVENQPCEPLPDVIIKTENDEVKTEEIKEEETWNTIETKSDVDLDLKEEMLNSPENMEDVKGNFIKMEVESGPEESPEMKVYTLSQLQTETCSGIKLEQLAENSPQKCVPVLKKKYKMKIYKCNTCDFKTIYKRNLRNHQQTHKDPSEVRMYKCEQCDFKTRHKESITTHSLKHKDPSEVHMYKCDLCDFESKYKRGLVKHKKLRHKPASDCAAEVQEVRKYKCDLCSYETKQKPNLKRHNLRHKDPSEVQWYKCDLCEFKTIHKPGILLHHLVHKDPSELHMYKCDLCDYESKTKGGLNKHKKLRHTDCSETVKEVRKYKCDLCSFETKEKGNLQRHNLLHKDPSEVEWYKCDLCDFKTIHKGSITTHSLQHKDPSEVHMYKCDLCDYENKFKRGLVNHKKLRHKPNTDCGAKVQEVPKHKCDLRSYETKQKENL